MSHRQYVSLLTLSVVVAAAAAIAAERRFESTCGLSEELKSEIRSYQPIVQLIKNTVVDVDGPLKKTTWTKLANFVDDFGSRLAGTQNLENAIDFMLRELTAAKLDNVHGENVTVPRWVRGQESAQLIKPRSMVLPILGLGGSIGTPAAGITARVIVVKSFKELRNVSNDVRGKIVVYNENYIDYGSTVVYRSQGASEASRLGAVAVLIRSVTPFSIGTPHTGGQHYADDITPIPTACIAVEYAEMLQRLYDRGIPLEVNLKMEARNEPPVTSRNVVAEIRGSTSPEKVVLVSGHLDSWDVGQGAMDDGGGAFISWMSLVVLRTLNLHPRRTIRSVLWTAEEEGYVGAQSYMRDHAKEVNNLTVVMESDGGTFTPTGLLFYGSKEAYCMLREVAKLMAPLNASIVEVSKYPVESDIEIWQKFGIPGIGLRNKNEKYFWFHHTEADMMTVEDPHALDLCTALFAAVSYVIADLSVELPKSFPSIVLH